MGVLTNIVKNGVIVLDSDVRQPEGTKVFVEVAEPTSTWTPEEEEFASWERAIKFGL